MSILLCGKYKLDIADDSVTVDLGPGHRALTNTVSSGEISDISTIGMGNSNCDIVIRKDLKGLKVGYSEMAFGITQAAFVALTDFKSGTCRAGIPAQKDCGEISAILIIDAKMSGSAMMRAVMTATEAITCAIQDLDVRDRFGNAGSFVGRIDLAVVTDDGSALELRSAGKHSKLGEIIGNIVYDAVCGSALRNGYGPDTYDVVQRLGRMGYGEQRLKEISGRDDILSVLGNLFDNPMCRVCFSSIAILDDETKWGLVPKQSSMNSAKKLIRICLGCEPEDGDSPLESFVRTSIEKAKTF